MRKGRDGHRRRRRVFIGIDGVHEQRRRAHFEHACWWSSDNKVFERCATATIINGWWKTTQGQGGERKTGQGTTCSREQTARTARESSTPPCPWLFLFGLEGACGRRAERGSPTSSYHWYYTTAVVECFWACSYTPTTVRGTHKERRSCFASLRLRGWWESWKLLNAQAQHQRGGRQQARAGSSKGQQQARSEQAAAKGSKGS